MSGRQPTARAPAAAAPPGERSGGAAAAQRQPVHIGGLSELPGRYKGVLMDQFGVLHDGQQPYPGALAAVRGLAQRGCRVLLFSNSSRRAAGALSKLEAMGFQRDWFAGVVTSGEVTWHHLAHRPDDWWRALGRRCLHFTWAARGAISLEGLGLEVVTEPAQADFILAHGTEALGQACGAPPQPAGLDALRALAAACASRGGVAMVVANPDLVTVDGAALRVMPGTLAAEYARLGGQVVLMGKPDPVIYTAALAQLQLSADEVLVIGDSLHHDIAGAQKAGMDSLFVAGGIHAEALAVTHSNSRLDRESLSRLFAAHGAWPTYTMPYMVT